MHNYQRFAQFYDALTENVDYQVRSQYLTDLFLHYGGHIDGILDIGCGTGELAKQLAEKGYRVTGLDLSDDMLTIAAAKEIPNAFFYHGDMTDFTLPEAFDACICTLDSLNHLPDLEAVTACVQCVYKALKPGGLFLFDVNTVYKHQQILGDNAFIYDEEGYFLAWDNELLDERRVRMLLDFFILNGDVYERYSEEIIETAYTQEELCRALNPYFTVEAVLDDLSEHPPQDTSERIYFICKRKKYGKSS